MQIANHLDREHYKLGTCLTRMEAYLGDEAPKGDVIHSCDMLSSTELDISLPVGSRLMASINPRLSSKSSDSLAADPTASFEKSFEGLSEREKWRVIIYLNKDNQPISM